MGKEIIMDEFNTVDDVQEQNVDVPEPAENETDESVEGETEVAEDAEPVAKEATEEEQEPAKPAQSAEENRAFAALRRELERQRAETEKLRAAAAKRDEYKAVLKTYYGYDGDDDDIIANLAAQSQKVTPEEYKAQKAAEKQLIEQRIANDPRYQQMQQFEIQTRAKLKMSADLAAIKSAFPDEDGKTMDEIENAQAVVDKIMKGYEPADAYYLANRDLITGKKANAAKQAALNAQSKEHLSTIGGSAGGNQLPEIPSGELAYYKDAFPDDSAEKLKQRYQRIKQRQGE